MVEQLEKGNSGFTPERAFDTPYNKKDFDALKRDKSDDAKKDTTGGDPKKDATNGEEKKDQPGDTATGAKSKLPGLKFSEGPDIFLPDMNWNDLLKAEEKVKREGSKPKIDVAETKEPGDKKPPSQPDTGDKKAGDKPDEKPSADKPTGDKPTGDKPTGEKPADDKKPEAPADPKNLFRDGNKDVQKIVYADKTREFTHDSNHNLTGVKQTDKTGAVQEYFKKDGNWYLKTGSVNVPLAGEFDLRPNGNFCLRNAANQPWQVESPDGKMSVEQPQVTQVPGDTPGSINRSRPKIELEKDKNGNVSIVKLGDATRAYKFDDSGKQLLQVTDRIKTTTGERVEEWTRQALPTGGFSNKFSRTQPPGSNELRSDLKPNNETGAYLYTDARGEQRTSQLAMQGEGQPRPPWKADIKMDDQNRFQSIENDRFKREYTYFEGTDKIKSYTVHDKKENKSATWTRDTAESDSWVATAPQDGKVIGHMKGEFAITKDGVHCVRNDGGTNDGPEGGTYGFLGDGDKVGLTANDGKTVIGTTNGQARYVRRPDGSTIAFTNMENSQISIYDAESKTRTNWNKGADGLWKSDSPYETDARKDLSFNDKGELTFVDDKGNKRLRTLAGEDVVQKKDGAKLVYDREGKLSKVMFGDVERTFVKDKGKIVGVMDKNARGESKTVFPPPLGKGERIEDALLDEGGDLKYNIKNSDGKIQRKVTERSNGMHLEHDADGTLKKSTKPNGFSRTFDHAGEGANKQLIRVQDSRATKDGVKTTTWARKALPGGGFTPDFQSESEAGKPKQPRKIGNVLPDGDYEYTTDSQKPGDKPRIQSMSAGDGSFSDSVDESHANLMETMEKNLDAPRLKRMEDMMKLYEQRMADRAQLRKLAGLQSAEQIDDDVSKTISRTYDHLNQMVNNEDAGTFYDKNQRAFLAENFMFHAQEPGTMDQGSASNQDWQGHGTCWIQAAHIWGMTQRTDHMADLLKQISLTGKYTTKNGGEKSAEPKTVSFSKDYLKFPQGFQETNWCISKATDMWDQQPGLMRQCDGDRSPVGKIFDYVLPVIGGRPQRASSMDGGTHESFTTTGNRWYTGNAEIMQMITGDKPCDQKMGDHGKGTLIGGDLRKTLLEKGTVLNYEPGHMKSIHLKKVEGQWCMVQDNQHGENDDRIIARISDIDRWAKGDRSVEQQTNELMKYKKFKLESDATIVGTIKPSADSNQYQQGPNRGGNGYHYYNYQPRRYR